VDRPAAARADSERIVAEYDVRTPGIDVLASALSGGNQQKFIIGREMSSDIDLLIASHPTRGVDVGAQAAIWDAIRAARRSGLAVLLVSADLDELIGLSDRISVVLRGRIVAEVDPSDVTPEQLGSAMTGSGRVRREAPLRPARRGPRAGGTAARDRLLLGHRLTGAPRRRRPGLVDLPAAAGLRAAAAQHGVVLNSATIYYLSALAVAIGFRMNLFNIGVDGQYRLAAMTAAWVGGTIDLPTGLHQLVIVLVAVLVGACGPASPGCSRPPAGSARSSRRSC
jgi:hypothetical protein